MQKKKKINSLSANALKKIQKVLDQNNSGNDTSRGKTPSALFGLEVIIAQITDQDGDNPWRYAWEQVNVLEDGTWDTQDGGLSGTTDELYCFTTDSATDLSVGDIVFLRRCQILNNDGTYTGGFVVISSGASRKMGDTFVVILEVAGGISGGFDGVSYNDCTYTYNAYALDDPLKLMPLNDDPLVPVCRFGQDLNSAAFGACFYDPDGVIQLYSTNETPDIGPACGF